MSNNSEEKSENYGSSFTSPVLLNKAIYKKMSEVMAEVGAVGKNQKNQAQGFKFRGIDDMLNALYPALVKHGVFMTPRVVNSSTEVHRVVGNNNKERLDKHVSLLVEYDFFCSDGSKVTVGPIACEGLDSGDKATNKALSAGLKYCLIQTFCIPTEDMVDGDSDSPQLSDQGAAGAANVPAKKKSAIPFQRPVANGKAAAEPVETEPTNIDL